MSELESLVPPLALCKLIPAGEFEDSCFVRIGEDTIILRSNVRVVSGRQDDIYPAPTLEEIMAAMQFCRVYKKTANFYVAVKEQERVPSLSGATAAMKLWLKLKGIEAWLNAPAEREGEDE